MFPVRNNLRSSLVETSDNGADLDLPTLSGSGDLLGEASDDPAGGVVLVQSVGQLLSGGLQLLPQSETVQHHSILVGATGRVSWGKAG